MVSKYLTPDELCERLCCDDPELILCFQAGGALIDDEVARLGTALERSNARISELRIDRRNETFWCSKRVVCEEVARLGTTTLEKSNSCISELRIGLTVGADLRCDNPIIAYLERSATLRKVVLDNPIDALLQAVARNSGIEEVVLKGGMYSDGLELLLRKASGMKKLVCLMLLSSDDAGVARQIGDAIRGNGTLRSLAIGWHDRLHGDEQRKQYLKFWAECLRGLESHASLEELSAPFAHSDDLSETLKRILESPDTKLRHLGLWDCSVQEGNWAAPIVDGILGNQTVTKITFDTCYFGEDTKRSLERMFRVSKTIDSVAYYGFLWYSEGLLSNRSRTSNFAHMLRQSVRLKEIEYYPSLPHFEPDILLLAHLGENKIERYKEGTRFTINTCAELARCLPDMRHLKEISLDGVYDFSEGGRVLFLSAFRRNSSVVESSFSKRDRVHPSAREIIPMPLSEDDLKELKLFAIRNDENAKFSLRQNKSACSFDSALSTL